MLSTSIFRLCAGMHHHQQHDCILHFCNLLLIRWGNHKESRLKFIFNKIACWFRRFNRLHEGCTEVALRRSLRRTRVFLAHSVQVVWANRNKELFQIMVSSGEAGHVDEHQACLITPTQSLIRKAQSLWVGRDRDQMHLGILSLPAKAVRTT